jgi:hypothetical protein
MKVRVVIESRSGVVTEHVANVVHRGDLLRITGEAMESYRKIQGDLPLFDYSTIRIERT